MFSFGEVSLLKLKSREAVGGVFVTHLELHLHYEFAACSYPLWPISGVDSGGEGGVEQVSLQLCLTQTMRWEKLHCFVFTHTSDM